MFTGGLILSFKLLTSVIYMIDTLKIIYTKTKEYKCTKIVYEKCAVWNGKCAVLNDAYIIGIIII